MRHIDRPPCPPECDATVPAIVNERARAVAYYDNGVGEAPTLNAYKLAGDVLDSLFGGKCAYCESRVLGTASTHVEHYRPKKEVVLADGSRRVGYWWLASTWENLVPACFDCNTVHKGNHFPLEDESVRASQPGEETAESPLLLDPCGDADPDEHLEFVDEGVLRHRTVKGSTTILVCGLHRVELTNDRAFHLGFVDSTIVHANQAVLLHNTNPSDETAAALERELGEIKRLLQNRAPFLAMTRHRLRAGLVDELVALIDP